MVVSLQRSSPAKWVECFMPSELQMSPEQTRAALFTSALLASSDGECLGPHTHFQVPVIRASTTRVWPLFGWFCGGGFALFTWHKHRFLGTEMLLCCKETELWVRWILFQYSARLFDHKAKRSRECLKQGKFFRWENPKIGGRKQFVPFSDSLTWGCQRMAGCFLHLNHLFHAYIARQCSHFLSGWP